MSICADVWIVINTINNFNMKNSAIITRNTVLFFIYFFSKLYSFQWPIHRNGHICAKFSEFCFTKHFMATTDRVDISGRQNDGFQTEQFLEWEREEEERWKEETQVIRKRVIRDEFDPSNEGLPSYMLDALEGFDYVGEATDVFNS